MTYDFDKIIQRRGTNCVKWDEVSDNATIPMWVADMDFETASCRLCRNVYSMVASVTPLCLKATTMPPSNGFIVGKDGQ